MAGTRLAVTTVDQTYGWGSPSGATNETVKYGCAGVLKDETTSIGVEGNKTTGMSGDTRSYWFKDGSADNKILLFQSRYERVEGKTNVLPPTIEIRDAKTWAVSHTVNQPADWPSILNVYGAVAGGGFLYAIDFDNAKIVAGRKK